MNSLFRLAAPEWTLLKDKTRLESLSASGIFATTPESEFDDIVALAAASCQTPTAMIAFADAEHLHFKGYFGANKPLLEAVSQCFFVPTVQDKYFVWSADPRRAADSLPKKSEEAKIEFFAGVPLASTDRQIIGILCVTDICPHNLTENRLEALLALGRHTERLLKLRHLVSDQAALINERNSEIVIRTLSESKLASALSRVSLINDIGKTARSGADPATILKATVTKLGKALSADRCYFVTYNPAENTGTIAPDWHVDGIPSLVGEYRMFDFPYNTDEAFLSGQTSVVDDVLEVSSSPGAQKSVDLGLRALIRAPILQDRRMTALGVGMAVPRKWTEEEVSLVEAIAAQARAAVETAMHTLHERALLRDVLASVTEGKLILASSESELPIPLPPYGDSIILNKEGGLGELRELIRAASKTAEHDDLRTFDLMTAASEAGMNAIVHADKGTAVVSLDEFGTIQVRIEDNGAGIDFDDLPKATLSRGYSTKETLGHGLKMMIETIDRLVLLTGPTGTTVVLEQEKLPPQPLWMVSQH